MSADEEEEEEGRREEDWWRVTPFQPMWGMGEVRVSNFVTNPGMRPRPGTPGDSALREGEGEEGEGERYGGES